MKNNLRIGGIITSLAAGLLLSSAAVAHHEGSGTAGAGYVGSDAIKNHYITDGYGNCVRSGSWKKSDMTVDCGAPAPKMEAKAPPPPAPPPPAEPVYQTTTLSAGALFDFNKDQLKPEGKAELDALAAKIDRTARVADVKVIGHTDSVGPEAYNQQLSVRRATTVRDYLVTKGVDPNLMSVSGMGESSPVADNATKAGRAKNRRVDVSIGVSQRVK